MRGVRRPRFTRREALDACIVVVLGIALALPTLGCGGDGGPGNASSSDARRRAMAGGKRDGGSPSGMAKMRGRGGRSGEWGGEAGDAEAPRVPVVVALAGRGDMEAFLDASSTLVAEDSVEVVSEATGVVSEILAEEGDRVSKGQTLARLAYEELELAEQRAHSEYEKLKADFARAQALARDDLIPEEDYQTVRFDLERASIDWEQSKLELERTRIKAPISGTVAERMITVGQLVRENVAVYQVVDFDSLVAPVYVPEKYLAELRAGQRTFVRARGLDTVVYEGRIERISPVVDAQSGTVKVTVALDRKSGLRPGMFATVQVVLDTHRNVVIAPKKALVFEDERPHVFVVRDGKAEKRDIDVGYQDADRVEIARGLESGEMIVLVGQSALKDGSFVEPQDEEGRPIAGSEPEVADRVSESDVPAPARPTEPSS